MIAIPDTGFTRSVNTNRMKIEIVCDWLEASVLFEQEEISTTDIADVLMENGLCDTDTIAKEIVDGVWSELRRRIKGTNRTYSLKIDGRFVNATKEWAKAIDHTFCLLLSLAPNYNWWTTTFGHSYVEQGELFELLTKASLEAQLDKTWSVIQTGWTRSQVLGLPKVVTQIANHLGETPRPLPAWISKNAKDLGLDLLVCRKFPDDRAGIPIYMLQCASGNNWEDKRFTPNLEYWKKIIDFYSFPVRGMSIPFCVSDDKFLSSCLDIKGLLIERCRLLNANFLKSDWLSDELAERLVNWCEPRVKEIIKRSR